MKLSILIVAYNTKELLLRCLESLKENLSGAGYEYEILVFDNGSSDATSEAVQKAFKDVILTRSERNLYYYPAQNRNAAQARGEYLLLLNSDVVFKNDAVTPLLEFMESDYAAQAPVAAVQGMLLYENGLPTPTGSRIPGLGDLFLEILPPWARKIPAQFFGDSGYRIQDWDRTAPRRIEILCDAFMLLRRKTFVEIGGYDQRFALYWGDADFSIRLGRTGALWHRPEGAAFHSLGATMKLLDAETRERILARDEARFVEKYFGAAASGASLWARTLTLGAGKLRRKISGTDY
jgi:GT2 family glycosyltransferase